MEETDQTNINIVIKDIDRDKRQCTEIVNQLLDFFLWLTLSTLKKLILKLL